MVLLGTWLQDTALGAFLFLSLDPRMGKSKVSCDPSCSTFSFLETHVPEYMSVARRTRHW